MKHHVAMFRPFFLVPFVALGLTGGSAAQSSRPSPLPNIQLYCPPGIDDASGAGCIGVSSVPQAGFLYPLGQDFFMTPAGKVGFGTTTPATRLDVEGTGGPDSTLRLLTTDAGAGGIQLQRSGGTPAGWSISYDTAVSSRDFLIRDELAAETRLRIDESGEVSCLELEVGDATSGVRFTPFGGGTWLSSHEGGSGSSTWMTVLPDEIQCNREVDLSSGARVGISASIQFAENDLFNLSPPMMYMFEDGANNFNRMVLAHSETFDDWGLRYDDDDDVYHFVGGGNGVMTVRLATGNNGQIGIENSNPTNILTILQGSPTDPIADAWTTYSSRRWKENIEPIEDALALVRALRGVTFDWKESGQHDLGMIAEEVGAVVPEVVAFEENGVDAQSIDYARLTAVLVEAVKEQERTIAELATRLDALEQQL